MKPMTKITNLFTVIIICTLIANVGQAQESKASVWEKISPFFSPPAELKNKFGDFRSPINVL